MGKQIRYTLEYKMNTVQMYLQGDLSANQLALNLGIHPHTVRQWIGDYNDGKLKLAVSDKERSDFHNRILCGQQEDLVRPDIGILISKINAIELGIKEMKNILLKYL